MAVNNETAGKRGKRTTAPVAISCIRRCPAVKFAVSRTANEMGRIIRLRVSIIISAGIKPTGVPWGRKCPRAMVGWFRKPITTVASQRGMASARFTES